MNKATQQTEFDVIIIGGGLIGLVLATALAQENFKISLIEANPPLLQWPKGSFDSRISAINLASQRILNHLNIWPKLPADSHAPIRRLIVWDNLGGGEICFDSTQVGFAECGFIVENRELVSHLWQNLSTFNNVQIFSPNQPYQLWRNIDKVQLILDDQQTLYTPLLIGADGGNSWVAQQMNVITDRHYYQQQALICIAKSEYPHQDTAWQNFLATGPIAFLPLADKHQGAIVWSLQNQEAKRILELGSVAFNFELTNALSQRLGTLTAVNEIKSLSLVAHHAQNYVSERIALVGDAAHTIHPLAGQGANLGLLDAVCLSEMIIESRNKGKDIGSLSILNHYQRQRKTDNRIMDCTMTGFNDIFSATQPWLIPIRSQGLRIANHFGFFKSWIMGYATGSQYFGKYKLTS